MNKKTYIDTHCHLFNEYFEDFEIVELVKEANENGIEKIILPGTTINNSIEALQTATKFDCVFPAVGIHPSESEKHIDRIEEFLNSINPKSIIAIGEVGLDFYWSENPVLKIQEKALRIQLDYAAKHGLPALIHTRNAEEDMFRILSEEKYSSLIKVIHSYTGNLEWAKKFVEIGCYISFSGIVTFKNAKQVHEVAKFVPNDKILSETDTPYLSPVPVRGKTNKPCNTKHVTDFIAKLRDDQTIIKSVYENALKIFDFSAYSERNN